MFISRTSWSNIGTPSAIMNETMMQGTKTKPIRNGQACEMSFQINQLFFSVYESMSGCHGKHLVVGGD